MLRNSLLFLLIVQTVVHEEYFCLYLHYPYRQARDVSSSGVGNSGLGTGGTVDMARDEDVINPVLPCPLPTVTDEIQWSSNRLPTHEVEKDDMRYTAYI